MKGKLFAGIQLLTTNIRCTMATRKKNKMTNSELVKAWKMAHPLEYAYQTLKDNARRRGKEFSLTLEQFKRFCRKTDYISGKGKTKTSYSIDRIENDKGYTLKNIQILPLGENSKKHLKIVQSLSLKKQ